MVVGSGEFVVVATAKIEISRGPLAILRISEDKRSHLFTATAKGNRERKT